MFDGKAFGEEIVSAVTTYVDKKFAELSARLDKELADMGNLFQKQLADSLIVKGVTPDDKLEDFKLGILGSVMGMEARIKTMEDSTRFSLLEVVKELRNDVEAYQNDLNDAIKKTQQQMDDVAKKTIEQIAVLPQPESGLAGKDGIDGKSVTVEDVLPELLSKMTPIIESQVEKAAAQIHVANGRDGTDGVGIKDGFIQRDGNLILTLSDGTTKDFGPIVGRDGVDGKNGDQGHPGLNGKDGVDGVDGSPGIDGKDGVAGLNGKDGIDGIGWDEMNVEYRENGLYLIWTKGDVVKEARVPGFMDRGIWEEKTYDLGDAVTWGGCLWIAQRDLPEGVPDSGNNHWRLAVKKGRDGRNGRDFGKTERKPDGR